MKILLLGAAGFIGTNLTIELAKKTEDEITLVDRSKAFFKPIVSMDLKNVHILEADLLIWILIRFLRIRKLFTI
jgi:UDP-glucose 4-epimerase